MMAERTKRFSLLEAVGIGAVFTIATLALALGARVIRLDLVPEAHAQAYAKGASPLDYMSVQLGTINGLAGPHLIIEGANVHVRSGAGSTAEANCNGQTCSGRGNLIVGYNETYTGHARTGSHNLVVGPAHGFTSYGGILGGSHNRALKPYANVSGGQLNAVTQNWGSVVGGKFNWASGNGAAILGGRYNRARGTQSTVCGGGGDSLADGNDATGELSSVLGGGDNVASGEAATVVGGTLNTASGGAAVVAAGFFNEASAPFSVVTGGGANTAAGAGSSVLGGSSNVASGGASSVTGGSRNEAAASSSAVHGGQDNLADGEYSVVVGGGGATAGHGNTSSAYWSVVVGGRGNHVTEFSDSSTILGGTNNSTTGLRSAIGGGTNRTDLNSNDSWRAASQWLDDPSP